MEQARRMLSDAAELADAAAALWHAQAEGFRAALSAADVGPAEIAAADDSTSGRAIDVFGLPCDWGAAEAEAWMRRRRVGDCAVLAHIGGAVTVAFAREEDAQAALLTLDGCIVKGSSGPTAASWRASPP